MRSAFRAAACGLALVLAACSSNKAILVNSPEAAIQNVNVGDAVRITSKNGKLYRFVVTRITNKAIYGDGYRVTYGEMSSLESQKPR